MLAGRSLRAPLAALGLPVLLALCLAGCGDTAARLPTGNTIHGHRLTIYVSVPKDGASALSGAAVVQGAQIALRAIHNRIGRYRLTMQVVDDSSPSSGQWNPVATQQAADTAADDPTTIGYVGDLNSGASAISLPILNRLAIAQISPASTAVGLTSDGLGSSPGEPMAYYPTTLRTFARVVPSDFIQAQVQVALQEQQGCKSTYVLDDDEYDGEAAAQAFDEVAARQHLEVVATQSYVPTASSYVSVGQTVQQSGADCVLIAAIADPNASLLATQVAQQAPLVQIFGTSGLAESTFVDPLNGGVPLSLDDRIMLTIAAGDPSEKLPGAAAFERAYAAVSGADSEPVAIDGFEAMDLMLWAIRKATHDGRSAAERVKVVKALFSARHIRSALGTFSIERDGDTTLRTYGVYRVQDGKLQFWRTMAG